FSECSRIGGSCAVGSAGRDRRDRGLRAALDRTSPSGRLGTSRPPAGHAVDVDSIDDDVLVLGCTEFGCAGQPPARALAEQMKRPLSQLLVLWSIADFIIPAENHHRSPVE